MAQIDDQRRTRAESSRINGAKSHGPVTTAGKQRSCLNRTTHGMRSSRVVLHNECQDTYNDLSARFLQLFSPRDILEQELVSNMINARWRIRRLEAASSANLDLAMEEARASFQEKFSNLDIPHEHALAYRAIAESAGHTDLMGRHEDRQHRIFERSYRLLVKHRGKQAAVPTNEMLLQAESELPPDNLPPHSHAETQNEAFEPTMPLESPPPPVVLQPLSKKRPEKSAKGETNHPFIASDEEYAVMKPIFDRLASHPELRMALSEAIRIYKLTHEIDLAA
jgi:hypothetical protein